MMYGSWDFECDRQNFLPCWAIFLTFYPPNKLKNQNFEKMKKTHGDIIILDKCTIKDNYMIYVSWDIKCNRHNFYVSLGHFLPFFPFNSLKIENIYIKKIKNMHRDVIILHKCTKNNDYRLYCSWDMAYDGCTFFFSFWAIFCPFTLKNPTTA